MFPFVVHQPATRGDNVVRMWAKLKRLCVSCVWMLQRGYSGDGCVLASTLCKYDLREGDLIVLSCARVRRATSVWWRCVQYFVIASCG